MHKINSWAKREARGLKGNPFSRNASVRRHGPQDSERALTEQATPRASEGGDNRMEESNAETLRPQSGGDNIEPTQGEDGANNVNGLDHKQNTDATGSTAREKEKKKKKVKTIDGSIFGQLKHALFNSWINILLIAAPVGIALHFAKVNSTIIFVVNFIAIIPLAGLLSYATEEIAIRVGEVLGGLLNASFGNAVELIVSIIALVKHEVVIVQTSLIGSILSNLLLVMGMCFFVGGYNRFEQFFNTTVAQTASSLLTLAVTCLIVPTAFNWSAKNDNTNSDTITKDIIQLSRGTAVIMLLTYASYLFFQLKTHAALFNEKSADATERPGRHLSMSAPQALAGIGGAAGGGAYGNKLETHEEEEEEEEQEAELAPVTAIILLAASTVLVALCAEFLVDSINDLVEKSGISRYFVGLILLPIVGNAAEHATAVTVAYKDKMDLAIGVAVGSSMQIALLVIPFVVILGWILGIDEMTLYFDGFQVIILFTSVLLVNYLIGDGKSNFLEGNLLISMYVIIAVAAWFYPNVEKVSPKTEHGKF